MTEESTHDRFARKSRKIERHIVRKAKHRVRSKVGFVWHLAIFCLVNAGLLAINLTHTPTYFWFLWPLAGWSVGLLLHATSVFMVSGVSGDMVAREIEREKARRGMVPSSIGKDSVPS
jgi:hypothetical protein